MAKAQVYLWTGDGWGKTTSALGAALRAAGHGRRVIVIQFMKNHNFFDMGEYNIRERLSPELEMYQFGKEHWVDLNDPSEEDKEEALRGVKFALEKIREKPFLLILDEINIALAIGLASKEDIFEILDRADSETHIYLTGRRAPKELIERADYVNEVVMIKGPKRLKGEEGIDY